MKFSQAMELLRGGSKVTRKAWLESMHFQMDDRVLNTYCPRLIAYSYGDDIMVSDGWFIPGRDEEYYFYEIIPFLYQGMQARLNHWEDGKYIYYDRLARCLNYHYLERIAFSPDFESFLAQDWIEILE